MSRALKEIVITTTTKDAKCLLTDPELRAKGRDAAEEGNKSVTLKEEADSLKKTAKTKLETAELHDKTVTNLLRDIRRGYEYRDVPHELVLLADRKHVTERRKDTGEETPPREPTPEEWSKINKKLQGKLDLDGDEKGAN